MAFIADAWGSITSNWRARNYELRLHEQLGWAMGSLGTGVMIGALTSYGMFYMTSYLGVTAGLAGGLITLSKFYDLISDPVMGTISDRTETKWGRRRPFLLVGALVCPLCIIVFYHLPMLECKTATIALIFFILLIYATAFTSFNVPYFAMPAEMTSNYHERTMIMSQRIFFSTMAVMPLAILGPYIIEWFGGGVAGYRGLSWLLAIFAFIGMFGAFVLTKNVAFTKKSERAVYKIGSQVRLILNNKPFCTFIIAKSFIFIGSTSAQGTLLFMGTYVLERGAMILRDFGIGYTIGVVATLSLWNHLITNVLGKRDTFMIAAIGLGLTLVSWWFTTASEPLVVFYIRVILLGAFAAGGLISGSAMLPDIMEYDRRRSGVSQEGLYAATFSLIEKIAYTVGPIMLGFLLGYAGFIETERGEMVDQPESAITAIRIAVALIPGVLSIIGGLIMCFYDLNEEKLKSL